MRKCFAAFGIALVSASVGTAAVLGAIRPAGGAISIFAQPGNGVRGPIVITGAIGDYGTTITMNKSGTPDANGGYVKADLRKGTFEINSTVLNAEAAKAQAVYDRVTCSFLVSVTAPVALYDGTGLYKGISGSARITIVFAGIAPLYKTGAHKGQCDEGSNVPPLGTYSSISGPGTVKFG
jgi:hypothetical protein